MILIRSRLPSHTEIFYRLYLILGLLLFHFASEHADVLLMVSRVSRGLEHVLSFGTAHFLSYHLGISQLVTAGRRASSLFSSNTPPGLSGEHFVTLQLFRRNVGGTITRGFVLQSQTKRQVSQCV